MAISRVTTYWIHIFFAPFILKQIENCILKRFSYPSVLHFSATKPSFILKKNWTLRQPNASFIEVYNYVIVLRPFNQLLDTKPAEFLAGL